jgi:nitronate monooxygenase
MGIRTRLTEALGITVPILSAPMGFVAGGKLAAAVTAAGGLGIIGGGYGDADWLDREFTAAGNSRVGCGFITWSLAKQPDLLTHVLAHAPAVLMLSFGDPTPFAPAIRAAGSRLICQVQTIAHTRAALDCSADIIVAQGSEAGGHGATRATLTLVPEVADLLARESPATLLVAAGGIADGRDLSQPDAGCGRRDVGLATMGKSGSFGASQSSTCGSSHQRRRYDPPEICRHRPRL